MALGELVDALVEVEDNGNGDNKDDQEDVRSEELSHDVAVYARERRMLHPPVCQSFA